MTRPKPDPLRPPGRVPTVRHLLAELFAQMLPVYQEATGRGRQIIADAVATINDPQADAGDRAAALRTLAGPIQRLFRPATGLGQVQTRK